LSHEKVVDSFLDANGAEPEGIANLSDLFHYLCLESSFFADLSNGSGVELLTFFLMALGNHPIFAAASISMANERNQSWVAGGNYESACGNLGLNSDPTRSHTPTLLGLRFSAMAS
jgi:hypothetical protein